MQNGSGLWGTDGRSIIGVRVRIYTLRRLATTRKAVAVMKRTLEESKLKFDPKDGLNGLVDVFHIEGTGFHLICLATFSFNDYFVFVVRDFCLPGMVR